MVPRYSVLRRDFVPTTEYSPNFSTLNHCADYRRKYILETANERRDDLQMTFQRARWHEWHGLRGCMAGESLAGESLEAACGASGESCIATAMASWPVIYDSRRSIIDDRICVLISTGEIQEVFMLLACCSLQPAGTRGQGSVR